MVRRECSSPSGARAAIRSSGRGRADGATVEIIVDLVKASLSFRVNSGPTLPAFVGLPTKDELRPCVGLRRAGDQVTLLCRPGDERGRGFARPAKARQLDKDEYKAFRQKKKVFLSLAERAGEVGGKVRV